MSHFELIALAGFVAAAVAMLFITQSKHRVAWPAWLVPAALIVPLLAWTGFAAVEQRLAEFLPLLLASPWGVQLWLDRLVSVTVAFFLLQNRARAAGLKSEVWVIAVIFTGSIGLLLMLALTLHRERHARMLQPHQDSPPQDSPT